MDMDARTGIHMFFFCRKGQNEMHQHGEGGCEMIWQVEHDTATTNRTSR